MSLLTENMEDCVMLYKVPVPDGLGGIISKWQNGAIIKAAIAYNDSTESRIGEAQGVTAVYTISTKKNINLQYHDVLRRISDGKIFRITSDGDDLKTPNSAMLNMRNVSAEEWELPQK